MKAHVISAVAAVLAIAAVLAFLAYGSAPEAEEPVIVDVMTERYAFAPGTQAPINVSKGDLVVLRVTSTDVTHGIAIQEYGIYREIPAGETVEIRFRADQEGEFLMYCTVFCGAGHPDHKGTLHVA